jgi:hypothetical protein
MEFNNPGLEQYTNETLLARFEFLTEVLLILKYSGM